MPYAILNSMRKVICSAFVVLLGCVNISHAQSDPGYDSYDPYYDNVRDPYYNEEVREEARRSRVYEQRAHRRHIEQNEERDEAFTEVYRSNVKQKERENVIDTVDQITEAVNGIAASANFISNLF